MLPFLPVRLRRHALHLFLFAQATAAVVHCQANGDDPWQTLGLMRVRDMSPFGLNRLDLLPAHAVASTKGTFGIEVNLIYQNTWAASRNVKRLLGARDGQRTEVGPEDVAGILDLPGDAYLVDGEFGLVDMTLHYRAGRHLGVYATMPYYYFSSGFLDATIEGFHDGIGIGNARRELVPRNRWVAVAKIGDVRVVSTEAPSADYGDPVFGVRWSLREGAGRWNAILEGAVKFPLKNRERLVSTGSVDFGGQLSLQRFFRRNALYFSLAEVYFDNPDGSLGGATWIPTVVAGWETRLSRHANFVLQTYWSKSTIQHTDLEELNADKLQATAGIQWLYRGYVLRFGVTENLASYDNTPDVGVTLGLGKILFGRDSLRPNPARP